MKRLGDSSSRLMLAASAFATNGTRIVGFNAKTIGRGGTTIGLFDSPMLMMTNPAGISFLSGSSIDANFSLMVPSMKFTNILNSEVEGKTNYFPMPGLSYAHQSPDAPLAWGIGVFTQGGMGADLSLKHQLFPTAQEYHSKLAVMQGGPSIAYKLTPQLSIGVSAHLVYSQLEFKMPYSLQPSIMKGIPNGVPAGMTFGALFSAPPAQGGFGYSEVTALADMNDLTGFSFGGKIGLAYNLNDDLSLGVSLYVADQHDLQGRQGLHGHDRADERCVRAGDAGIHGCQSNGHPAAGAGRGDGAVHRDGHRSHEGRRGVLRPRREAEIPAVDRRRVLLQSWRRSSVSPRKRNGSTGVPPSTI